MKREILVRLPKLNDCGGDINKKWFIFFSVRNPKTGRMERFKKYDKLHSYKSSVERYRCAKERIAFWTERLQAGWTPFDDNPDVIYNDQLVYDNIAAMYGRKRAANRTFRFYASNFIESVSGLDPETIVTYKSKLRIFSQWLDVKGYSQLDITAIGQKQIFDFFDFIINERKRSRNTVKKYRQLLVKVYEFAIKDGAVKVCPVQNLPACTREIDMAARPIHMDDIETFLKAIDARDSQLGMFVRFEYNCFMRPKELRHMRIKWIDFASGTITTPRDILKTRHDRVTVIPRTFLQKLRTEYCLPDYGKELFVFGNKRKPGVVMTSKNTFRNRFVAFRTALKMPLEYKLYSFKHSGNVKAEQLDIPIADRMHQNGHLSIKTTEVYITNKIGRAGNAFKEFEAI